MKKLRNFSPIIGAKEGTVPFKCWQYLPPFCFMHKYTRSQNLGQTYNGELKYKTMSDGNATGQGYAFEDLHEKAQVKAGHIMEKVPATKNGADYIDNGEPVQLKCSKDGWRIARSLYERKGEDDAYGTYRYPGQTIVVPKDKGKYVEWHSRNRARNGYTDNPKSVVESQVTCAEVDSYYYKGNKSFWMDFKDPKLVGPAIAGGFIVGVASYAIARDVIESNCCKKNKEMTWKHEMLAAGIGSLLAVASTAGFLCIGCAHRQSLRPRLP